MEATGIAELSYSGITDVAQVARVGMALALQEVISYTIHAVWSKPVYPAGVLQKPKQLYSSPRDIKAGVSLAALINSAQN